jgi:YVTN family beta-propeller protein
VIRSFETGPITNHVNFAATPRGTFAYVTVGGLNLVRVLRTDDFSEVATIPVGKLPHGIWPSGDGSRVYVGLENADALAVIDTASNMVVAELPVGQAPQAVTYVSNAVPQGDGRQNLQPLGVAASASHLGLGVPGQPGTPTSVSLFEQGLTQVLQASVTGLPPRKPFALALAEAPDGGGAVQPLAAFMTNPAGSAIVNAVGPIRQLVRDDAGASRRYLVVVANDGGTPGAVQQVQQP